MDGWFVYFGWVRVNIWYTMTSTLHGERKEKEKNEFQLVIIISVSQVKRVRIFWPPHLGVPKERISTIFSTFVYSFGFRLALRFYIVYNIPFFSRNAMQCGANATHPTQIWTPTTVNEISHIP